MGQEYPAAADLDVVRVGSDREYPGPFVSGTAPRSGALDRLEQTDGVNGLDDVVVGAGADCLDRRIEARLAGGHEDDCVGPRFARYARDVDAVAVRQHDIADDEVRSRAREVLEGDRAGTSPLHAGTLLNQDAPGDLRGDRVVLDNEGAECVESSP